MCATTDAEERLNQLESEFREIQEGLKFPFDLSDRDGLARQSETVLAEARNLCTAFNIARPAWTLAARSAVGK
jgi:hypothetical protein